MHQSAPLLIRVHNRCACVFVSVCASQKRKCFESAAVRLSHSVSTNYTAATTATVAFKKNCSDTLATQRNLIPSVSFALQKITAKVIITIKAAAAATAEHKKATIIEASVCERVCNDEHEKSDDRKEQKRTVTE